MSSPRIALPSPASAALVEAFRGKPTANVSDNLSRLPGAVGLRPFHGNGYMAGSALTVKTRPGDNLAIHQALDLIRPGDVIVVDGAGDLNRALVGEIMMEIAKSRGAAGFVIDGAIRDVGAFGEAGFPCFARAAFHKGPYKSGPGEIGVPVCIGGMVVNTGDVVLGDEDGVVAFPAEGAEALLEAVIAQGVKEAEIIASIRAGTYQGAYGAQKNA